MTLVWGWRWIWVTGGGSAGSSGAAQLDIEVAVPNGGVGVASGTFTMSCTFSPRGPPILSPSYQRFGFIYIHSIPVIVMAFLSSSKEQDPHADSPHPKRHQDGQASRNSHQQVPKRGPEPWIYVRHDASKASFRFTELRLLPLASAFLEVAKKTRPQNLDVSAPAEPTPRHASDKYSISLHLIASAGLFSSFRCMSAAQDSPSAGRYRDLLFM